MPSRGFSSGSARGDATRAPIASLARGAVRISGTVERGASWHVVTDRLGWTTVVLVGSPPDRALEASSVDAVVRAAAERGLDPVRTARALAHRFGDRIDACELGILRVGPRGCLAELLNVSLPAILHHDPRDGVAPYEAVGVEAVRSGRAATDVVRLEPGALLLATTCGVLPRNAGWAELARFVTSLCFDQYGGELADVPPDELGRLLRSSLALEDGPRAVVAVGLPPAERLVA
ncbi:MAG: hypothetical protein KF729_27550 [Sandaracinaceae bacterium]|nr:hypothetical protein [Sandaracinaceae bacterium]